MDNKSIEMRDIYDKVRDLMSELDDKIVNMERSLANSRTEDIKQMSPGNGENKETKDTNHQINCFRPYENKSRQRRKELPCKMHGGHKARDCRTSCGFCLLKGSHKGEDCRRQNEMINQWIEECVQKYGVTAKATAESYIKNNGILRPTEEKFEKRLKDIPKQ